MKDDGAYEEPVSLRRSIPQVYHQAKWPSQRGKKQTEQSPQPNIYDEINEKEMQYRTQPGVVCFGLRSLSLPRRFNNQLPTTKFWLRHSK